MNAVAVAQPQLANLCERVTSLGQARDIYLSSQAVVDISQPEGRRYLDALAFRLGLPPGMNASSKQPL